MRTSFVCAAMMVAVAWMQPVRAQTASPAGQVTAASLAAACGVVEGDPVYAEASGYCRGFLTGAGQYHVEISRSGGAPALFCLSDPAPSLDQVAASFAAWVKANPQYGEDKAVDGLMRWATTTYPCPQPSPAPARRAGRR